MAARLQVRLVQALSSLELPSSMEVPSRAHLKRTHHDPGESEPRGRCQPVALRQLQPGRHVRTGVGGVGGRGRAWGLERASAEASPGRAGGPRGAGRGGVLPGVARVRPWRLGLWVGRMMGMGRCFTHLGEVFSFQASRLAELGAELWGLTCCPSRFWGGGSRFQPYPSLLYPFQALLVSSSS